MSVAAFERLVHTYSGYVADLEGSGVAVLDRLFVRDTIQAILHWLTPEAALSPALSTRLDDRDVLLREERRTFLIAHRDNSSSTCMSEGARLRWSTCGKNWVLVEDILRVADGFLDIVRARVHQDNFELSQHAQREAAAEQISVDDITHAMLTGQELEPYPDDPRGPSCFMVGQDRSGRWIHVLCGNFDRTNVLIIPVSLPPPPKWHDPWTRRVNP